MNLKSVFTDIAFKKLTAVDLPHTGSNQHELNGDAALKAFFGTSGKTFGTLEWFYFADDREVCQEAGDFTFYDARAKSAARTKRSEWRFYYFGNFLAQANPDDWIFMARNHENRLFGLVFQRGSAWLRAAKVLFGVQESKNSFSELDQSHLDRQEIELIRRQILTELGFDVLPATSVTDEEIVAREFGEKFPNTKQMSAFARGQTCVDWREPDEALICWLNREEELFLALEKILIQKRLDAGFQRVEDFVNFSLSIHQRRKARMGHALQNHLETIFDAHGLNYTAQAKTEGKRRPDFIFPGEQEYHNSRFPSDRLLMLGAKATCKDRWRQILVEAKRIPKKHLCTLQPSISIEQTAEMHEEQVTLVIPKGVQVTYTKAQLSNVLSLEAFVALAKEKQS